MGKKIKKAVKKVARSVKKVSGGVLGGEADVPDIKQPTPATEVATPDAAGNEEGDKDRESARKAARARGKRGLSVARSSGTGLNI